MSFQSAVLPPEYNYVLAVAATSTLVHLQHFLTTSRRRKAAKVPYPIAYAPQEEADKDELKAAFNAAQKSHSNFVENYTPFLTTLAIGGLYYPNAAAISGALWVVGRSMYAWGYARVGKQYSQNGKGRLIGSWASGAQLALVGMAIYGSVKTIL